ncbi:hypothetical protein [Stenotrophomonas sp. STM01]|uniref:hypothetical protein n=1 Tax=Stenotrophomonas sp. STM01 TaxID=2769278 RepID=UPI0031BB409E
MLVVGERHEGPEGWDNWLLCDTQGQEGVGFRSRTSVKEASKPPLPSIRCFP